MQNYELFRNYNFMSLLELTVSYTNTKLAIFEEFDFPVVTYRQRRTIIIVGFSLFIIFAIMYLYIMGSIVSKNYELNKLSIQLERASSRVEEAEQLTLGAHSAYTADYFIERGYVKPSTLGVIKKSTNVAEAHISSLY